MRSIVVLLLDGLGDRAYEALGGRTSNEAASTPMLDALAAGGSSGLLWPLGPGRAPASELAHWAMLGYAPEEFPGRAVLEALGRGRAVDPGDALAFAALRPAVPRGNELWLAGRASPDDEEDAAALTEAIESETAGGLTFRLSHVGAGEAILCVSGSADDRITDSDPFFADRHPVLLPQPLVPAATATAAAVADWTRAVARELNRHPRNRDRAARGKAPLNVVTLKWWGRLRAHPSFVERHGLEGAVVGASPFLRGLAVALGLEPVTVNDPNGPGEALARRLDEVEQLLDAGAGFILCHQKTLDEAGHSKDPSRRVDAIEALDGPIGRLAGEPFTDAIIAVTGDHATPAVAALIHSGDPVPFVLTGAGVRSDGVDRFGEADCAQGFIGRLSGSDVMPVLLNAADRPLFLGSRPTAIAQAAGVPARVVPLDV